MFQQTLRRPEIDAALLRRVVRVSRAMHRAGFVAGTAGNLSVRLGGGRFLATPSGVAKRMLTGADLLVVDAEGEVLHGRRGRRPTSEMPMHLEVYRRRPDVGAVVHAHPVHAVALSLSSGLLGRPCLPEAVATLGEIAVTPYTPPSSRENAEAIRDAIVSHDAIVLRLHGSLTVGASVEEAFGRLEVLEHTARILVAAAAIGPVPELTPEQTADLRGRGAAYRENACSLRPA